MTNDSTPQTPQIRDTSDHGDERDPEIGEYLGNYRGSDAVMMTDLPAGAQFIGPDGKTLHEVTVSAADDPHGWVHVRDLSMSGFEARRMIERGEVEQGTDPRDGVFIYSDPVPVKPVSVPARGAGAASDPVEASATDAHTRPDPLAEASEAVAGAGHAAQHRSEPVVDPDGQADGPADGRGAGSVDGWGA